MLVCMREPLCVGPKTLSAIQSMQETCAGRAPGWLHRGSLQLQVSAQAMVSQVVGSSPTSGSALMSLLGFLYALSLLMLSRALSRSLSLSFSKNK